MIAIEEGFHIHPHKTRVMPQSQRQHLVGLVVNQRANVSRAARDRLEAILTNAVRHGLAGQNRENDPHFLDSLRGRVAWVRYTNPAHVTKLERLLQALGG